MGPWRGSTGKCMLSGRCLIWQIDSSLVEPDVPKKNGCPCHRQASRSIYLRKGRLGRLWRSRAVMRNSSAKMTTAIFCGAGPAAGVSQRRGKGTFVKLHGWQWISWSYTYSVGAESRRAISGFQVTGRSIGAPSHLLGPLLPSSHPPWEASVQASSTAVQASSTFTAGCSSNESGAEAQCQTGTGAAGLSLPPECPMALLWHLVPVVQAYCWCCAQ